MNCPNCAAEMTAMTLEAHLTAPVTLDVCKACQAFWFDKYESLKLAAASTLKLMKFSSCADQLAPQPGFPVMIGTVDDATTCPLVGLDRCNMGSRIAPVAVDDINAQHIYAAFATSTSSTNDDVIVADSNDGGVTWSSSVVANAGAPGRRFMPWVCTTDGVAMLSWYDRRAAAKIALVASALAPPF